jgi:hypothetical protein
MQFLPRDRAEAEARHDLVRSPGEKLERALGIRSIDRLAEDDAVANDHRVDAKNGTLVGLDGARLPRSVLDRVIAALDVIRRNDLERDVQLVEDRASLRRRRRE